MSITIKESFPIHEWETIRDFLSRHYRPDLALCSRKIFEWQFLAKSPNGEANIFSAWNATNLVGILGFMPTPLFWGNFEKPIAGAWIMNWMIEPDHRHGLGWILLRKLQKKYPVILSLGANDENLRVVRELGWSVFPRIPRYLSILDLKATIPFAASEISETDLKPFVFKHSNSSVSTPLSLDLNRYNPNWPAYSPMAYGTVRSKEYLQWRYLDSPGFKYHVVTSGSETRPAICVYRVEHSFGIHEGFVGRIVEFFHPNDAQGRTDGQLLMKGVMQLLKERGCAYVDFLNSSGAYGQTLLEMGWKVEPVETQILPQRFAPIQHQISPLNVEYGLSSDLPTPTLKEMYLTRSDCDADRLSRQPELFPQSYLKCSFL